MSLSVYWVQFQSIENLSLLKPASNFQRANGEPGTGAHVGWECEGRRTWSFSAICRLWYPLGGPQFCLVYDHSSYNKLLHPSFFTCMDFVDSGLATAEPSSMHAKALLTCILRAGKLREAVLWTISLDALGILLYSSVPTPFAVGNSTEVHLWICLLAKMCLCPQISTRCTFMVTWARVKDSENVIGLCTYPQLRLNRAMLCLLFQFLCCKQLSFSQSV